MPSKNAVQLIKLFIRANQIAIPDMPRYNEQFEQIIQDFADVIEKSPAVILLIPGLTFDDLINLFNRKLSHSCLDLSSNKSSNLLLLQAFLLKPEDLKITVKELKTKKQFIPELERELHKLQTECKTPDAERIQQVQLEITKRTALPSNLAVRDAKGRHIVQFAALAGNYENLVFLLQDQDVLNSLTENDKQAIVDYAFHSQSIECIYYVMGTFAMRPETMTISRDVPFHIKNVPLLTRKQIEFAFDTMTREDLYAFLAKYSDNDAVLKSYLLFGGDLKKCEAMLARLRDLELCPLMKKPEYDIDVVIRNQVEFKGKFLQLDTSKMSESDRAAYMRILENTPFIISPNDDQVNSLLKSAVENDNLPEFISLFHRYNYIAKSFLANPYFNSTSIEIFKYLVEKKQIIIQPDTAFLYSAALHRNLEMVRFLIEECGVKENTRRGDTPLSNSLNTRDNPVMTYLLNRGNFLTDQPLMSSLPVFDDLLPAFTADFKQTSIGSFEFSETGLRNLFMKPLQELHRYLTFVSKNINRGSYPGGININALPMHSRLEAFQKLLALERDLIAKNQDATFVLPIEANVDIRDLGASEQLYNSELAQHYEFCLKVVSDPFKTDEQRAAALAILELSAAKNRFGAADPLQKAHKIEAMRLAQLVENQQGNVVQHVAQLERLAKADVLEAKESLSKYNDRLAVELCNKAGSTKDGLHERQLRELASKHPYAQLQVAILLIRRHQALSLRFLNRQAATAARTRLFDPRIAHFPETLYYQGECLREAIGGDASIEKAMHYYFLAAKGNYTQGAEILKTWNKTKSSSNARPDVSCRAAIYCAVLDILNKPRGFVSPFDDIAAKYKSTFINCMSSIAELMETPDLKIMLWQAALERVTTSKDRELLDKEMSTYLMKLNLSTHANSLLFAKALDVLTAKQCVHYALRFINDNSLAPETRRVWIVAAEMKWVAQYTDQECPELTNLRGYLTKIDKAEQEQIRMSLKSDTAPAAVIAPPTPTVVVPNVKTLQQRYDDASEFADPIPDDLIDPIHFGLMSDPGSCDDGLIYDRCTFEEIKGKQMTNIVIQNFTPLHPIRRRAIELVEKAERAKQAQESATKTVSTTAAIQSGLTFFTPNNPAPSAPPLDKESAQYSTHTVVAVNNNQDDDGDEVVTYPEVTLPPVAVQGDEIAEPVFPAVIAHDDIDVFGQELLCVQDELENAPLPSQAACSSGM